MAYARVVNMEFKTDEYVEVMRRKQKEWAVDNDPPAISRTNVRKAEATVLPMAIYEIKELADAVGDVNMGFFSSQANLIDELIDFHGPFME